MGVPGFYTWRRRISTGDDTPAAEAATVTPPRFLRFDTADVAPTSDPAPITARFPDGVTLTVGRDDLQPLVAALRETTSC